MGKETVTIKQDRVKNISLREVYQAASIVTIALGKTPDINLALNELGLTGLPERKLLYDALTAGLSRQRKLLRPGSQEEYKVVEGVVEQLKPLFPWYQKGKESGLPAGRVSDELEPTPWGYRKRRG